jgi:hypothetical protein
MKKSLYRLLMVPIFVIAGMAAGSENPAAGPSLFTMEKAQEEEPATNASASDWSPPTQQQLPGAAEAPEAETVETDGTSVLPTLEWRASADWAEMGAAAADKLAPRVELPGPGTPKWKVITYVSERTTIDDNIFISNSNKQSDVYFSIAPGFAAGWGDFRSALLAHSSRFSDQYGQTREPVNDPLDGNFAYLNYTATATHFVSHDSLDAIDQDGAISAQWAFTKLLLGVNARFQTLSGPDIDVGTRTRRDIFTLDTTGNYSISDRTSIDVDAGGVVRQYATELNSSEWHAQVFSDYQLYPKTSIGAGIVAGVRELQTSPNQYYEQAQLRAGYNATAKLTINVNGGLEIDEADGATKFNPVFGVGVSYLLNEKDTLSLSASRSTSSSAVTTGETVENTGIDFQVRHRLYSSFSIACSVGYNHAEYYQQGLSTLVRTDNYVFIRPSLAYDFAEWSEIELAYEYHRDVSTIQPFDFAENLASLQFNFVF